MAPRENRFNRGQHAEASSRDAADLPSKQIPASRDEEAEGTKTPPQGISILKEIFPEHGSGEGTAPALAQQMLLNSIPTPARACSSPVPALTSTTPISSPSLSPLPVIPTSICRSGTSYRERLRAGGREAFQRAFGVGLMPKTMRQEAMNCSDMQFPRPDATFNGFPVSQNATPISSPMSYSSVTDSHAVWDAPAPMQSADYWPSQMEHPLLLEQPQMMGRFGGSQDVPQMSSQFQQDQYQQAAWRSMPMQQMQRPELPPQAMQQMQQMQQMHHMQQMQPDLSPQAMQQMQMPHMQVQVPQMHMQRMELDSSPTELHRCMAIVMPETAQFPCDKNMVAAQLQAAADCQCYED
jgi:hypothetical protein